MQLTTQTLADHIIVTATITRSCEMRLQTIYDYLAPLLVETRGKICIIFSVKTMDVELKAMLACVRRFMAILEIDQKRICPFIVGNENWHPRYFSIEDRFFLEQLNIRVLPSVGQAQQYIQNKLGRF